MSERIHLSFHSPDRPPVRQAVGMDFSKEDKEIKKLCEQGWEQFQTGEFEAAWQSFEMALLFDSEIPMANCVGAACLFRLNKIEEAEALARKGVELAPHISLAHLFVAEILSFREKNEEAEFEFWEAISIDSTEAYTRLAFGKHLFFLNNYDKALEQFEKAIDLAPDFSEAHFMMGVCYGANQGLDQAIEKMMRTLTLEPQHDRAYSYLGCLVMVQAQQIKKLEERFEYLKRAAVYFNRAMEINPNNEQAKEYFQAVMKYNSQVEKAIERKKQTVHEFFKGLASTAILLFLLNSFNAFRDKASLLVALLAVAIGAAYYLWIHRKSRFQDETDDSGLLSLKIANAPTRANLPSGREKQINEGKEFEQHNQ